MTAKSYPTLHVASCLTGVVLCHGLNISVMQEIASHLYGQEIWTHELVYHSIQHAYVDEGYRQFPGMPTRGEAEADHEVAAAKALAAYGDSVTVEPGTSVRTEGPIGTLSSFVDRSEIIVVKDARS